MAAPAFSASNQPSHRLADPALREALLKFARRRLPPGEVDDLVQNTLADALGSPSAPNDEAEFRRWVQGIARHKIADLYRRRGRLPPLDSEAEPAEPDPGPGAGELTQWIEQELPKTDGAQATLHWLLRESEGETLDEIARDAALPAPRVRQRVSRLRRHFQNRWLALGAAGLALLIGIGAILHLTTQPKGAGIAREAITPLERARALRQGALEKCAAAEYRECVAGLDQAKALDPLGEEASAVREARSAAVASTSTTPAQSAPASTPSPDSKSAPQGKLDAPHLKPNTVLHPKSKALPKQGVSPKQALPNKKAMSYDNTKEFRVPEQEAYPQQEF
jgi:RNA polymerase sigma factor (sigma-70 family)